MWKLALFLVPAAAMFAQLNPNSVTVTASRNTVVPSDEIVFNVTLAASPDAGFDEALAAVSAAGVMATDFRGVTYSQSGPALWLFTKTAPLADQKATVGLLAAVQQSLAREKKFMLSFQIGGTELSAAALEQAQKCPLADLIAEARAKAANLAAASGATAGAILALTGDNGACSVTARFALGGVGQTGPGSITVTARNTASNPAPNRIAVTLTVSADAGVGFDQIVQAAAPAGVSATDLLGVSQPAIGRVCAAANIMAPCNPAQWTFRYTAPLSKWKDALSALARAREAKHPGIALDFQITADAPPAPDCAMPTLVSQARKRAQELAAAAGVGLGALNAVSDGTPQQAAAPVAINAVLSFTPFRAPFFSPTYAPGCSAVAQFVLTGNN